MTVLGVATNAEICAAGQFRHTGAFTWKRITSPPTRRTLVRTAAWGIPAITVASAAPAFAASSNYDLRAQSFQLGGAYNWSDTGGTTSGFYGVGFLSWTARICNDGPAAAPAGTQIAFLLGMGPYFDSVSVVSDEGLGLTPLGARTQEPATYGDDQYFRSSWAYRVTTEIAAGTCYTVTLKARLRRTATAGYAPVQTQDGAVDHKGYLINTHMRITAPDGNETNSANNVDASDTMRQVRVHVNSNTGSAQIPGTYTALPQT